METLRSWTLAAACLVLVSCTASPPRSPRGGAEPPLLIEGGGEPEPKREREQDTEGDPNGQLVEAHNALRARKGLPPLEPSPALSAAAQRHARDMAAHRRMRHRGSDGTTPFQRMSQEGYEFRAAAENVAAGQPTVDAVMAAWWRSPPHRANLLGNFSQIGTGTATDQDGTPYWCVTFGKPSGG